ncbi:Zn(II)2Cys6 transcription factor [Aspergillus fumigatus Af293]|uniref:C6 transcription factor, putative n=2 Tax=Aspergillus fumigatus TaxID=746128 RepID=Q4WA86_ASPFU|nr:C6 transcription factor, putative [Aspergillus fumigatus Af293]EAL84850.1 C6 transcription factor, putative [Aspergillus fumigatus Af293]EDP47991.1 C6 transcription factor, putative [Aspergillus fumigatus A1163]
MESPRGTPTRLFKSCRRCRKLKMRCDARHQIPCSRCQATGHDCIVDTINRGQNERRNQNKEQTRFNPLSPTSSSLSSVGSFNNRGSTGQSSLEIQHITSQDMVAPQSAMHSMSVNLGAPNEQIFIGESENDDPTKDVVERGIITEEQARGIYERFMNGSKNFLPLFDPVRDTYDSIRSRSLFCFTVIIYLASRAVPELRSNNHLQRVLQDEAQKLAEESFFERPTKLETVQGMILLAAYSEKSWFSTALILRTALDSGLEKSLDTLLAQTNTPRSYLSATMEDRILVWQTRTWLITYTTELDIAAGTGRKSRVNELDVAKLRKYLDYPLSLPSDMRTVCVIEIHQLRARARRTIDSTTAGQLLSTELPAIMARLEEWWKTWDRIHDRKEYVTRLEQEER